MLTRVDPAFDRPVILFQDVIEVLHRSVLAVVLQNTLVFELHNRRRVSGMLVGVDDSRHGWFCRPTLRPGMGTKSVPILFFHSALEEPCRTALYSQSSGSSYRFHHAIMTKPSCGYIDKNSKPVAS